MARHGQRCQTGVVRVTRRNSPCWRGGHRFGARRLHQRRDRPVRYREARPDQCGWILLDPAGCTLNVLDPRRKIGGALRQLHLSPLLNRAIRGRARRRRIVNQSRIPSPADRLPGEGWTPAAVREYRAPHNPGTTLQLIVPARFTNRLSIGWDTPSHWIIVKDCANTGGAGWQAYAGGFWIHHPACVSIIVRMHGKQRPVHVGIGAPRPGQRPPLGPSDS